VRTAYSQKVAAAILVAVLGPATRALAVPSPGSVNLLVNSGFETGDFFGWTVGGTSPQFGVATDGTPIPNVSPVSQPAFQNVRSGNFAANSLVKDFPEIGDFWRIVLTQTVAVLPNHDYVVGFWLGTDTGAGFGMTVDDQHTQIFVDGFGVLPTVFPTIFPGDGPEDFKSFSQLFNSGSRASVEVAFAINGAASASSAASFDDFFLAEPEIVPEPGTLSLLALGFATVGVRRLLR